MQCASHAAFSRRPGRFLWTMAAGAVVTILAGCSPPVTDVVDLQLAPQATWDAMLNVQILPLGLPAPPDVGSVGPVLSYGCGAAPIEASTNAVQQLRAKALRLQAVAVMDVLLQPGGRGAPCGQAYAVMGSGIALAHRGIPSTW
jgi:hypothetical protein